MYLDVHATDAQFLKSGPYTRQPHQVIQATLRRVKVAEAKREAKIL